MSGAFCRRGREGDGSEKEPYQDHANQLDEQGRGYLDRVRAATLRMAELIDDLLNLSRITRAPLNRSEVESVVADGLVTSADRRLCTVLLENLLGNAWKSRPRRQRRGLRSGPRMMTATSPS